MKYMIQWRLEDDPRPCIYREYADICAAPPEVPTALCLDHPFVQEVMALLHRHRARNGLPMVEPCGMHYDTEGDEWVCCVRQA